MRAVAVDLSVVIVSYNCREILRRCLKSLFADIGEDEVEVLVIDNASGDGAAEMVAAEFPGVRLIANRENRGFAAATNQGIRAAGRAGVLLLNPDTEVAPGALRAMMEFLDRTPEAGAVGAQLLNPDGSIQTSGMYRRFPSIPQTLLFFTFLRRFALASPWLRDRYFEDLCRSETAEVHQLPGACALMRREALDAVGPLSEDYFIWFEDTDWCYRLRRAGWKLYRLGGAKVFHIGGATLRAWDAGERFAQFNESLLLFVVKNQGVGWATLHWGALLAMTVLEAPFLLAWAVFARGRRRALLSDYVFRLRYLPANPPSPSGAREARAPMRS